ncbi:MAG: RluA family pseudouridine synthase [Verrucomicrobia bacterium]|nr:RluA family pseudouridine synthase [Verrucomicrobiota bacterium]
MKPNAEQSGTMRYLEAKVTRAENGSKLREFLATRLRVSGRRAKALLDAHDVTVNGRRVWMAGHSLALGDVVGVVNHAREENKAGAAPLRVLMEDAEYLVADKPPGMPTNGPDSFEVRLRVEREEPGLLAAHRLDRDTSGCVIVARNQSAFDAAVEMFREHKVTKIYRAIAVGRLHVRDRTIDAPVEDQRAVSRVTTIGATTAASHLSVETLTGRTHQIRLHLAGIGHPVLGDRQYGPPRALTAAQMRIPRQMLHAMELRFPHPRRTRIIAVQSRLPDDFKACLEAFRLPA